MEYIDAKKLRSEVERIKETGCESPILVCDDILSFIDYLEEEQPDVDLDLDKELDRYFGVYRKDGKTYDIEDGEECVDWKEMFDPYNTFFFAEHFIELGKLKAKKEE